MKPYYALSVLLMSGAMAAFMYGIDTDICVPVAVAGILVMLGTEASIWLRRRRLGPGRAEVICGSLALLCGVQPYYMPDNTMALLGGVGGFFLFIFLGFAAQIWGQMRETRKLWRRWRAWRETRAQERTS